MNKVSASLLQRHGHGCSRFLHAPVAAVVSLLVSGCDVQWGGVQVEVGEPEFERQVVAEAPEDTTTEAMTIAMPAGPVLFHVRRTDLAGNATIEPVGELSVDGLRPVGPQRAEHAEEYVSRFVADYYEPDRAYTLFRDGFRVGTLRVRSSAVSGSGLCLYLRAEGIIELRAPADTMSEFHAWPAGTRMGPDSIVSPDLRDDMVAMSQVLARRSVTERQVEGTWRFQAPTDFRALRIGSGRFGFAATFMVRDVLGSGSPTDSAGMAFLVADYNRAVGYFPIYVDVGWYGSGEKRALRWIDAADLLGDSEPEWLLQAFGDAGSWYEVVARVDTTMAQVWSSRRPICEAR